MTLLSNRNQISAKNKQIIEAADLMADDAFEQGYIQATLDSGVASHADPLPTHLEELLYNHLCARKDSRAASDA